MPSPFPGMDPYLEHPDIFPDFHDGFVTYLRELLQLQLPPPYYAGLGRRTWIEVTERFIGPDVEVQRPRTAPEGPAAERSAVAVAQPPRTEPVVIHVPHHERREPLVEIYTGQGTDRRLVSSIELLTLNNKTPGIHGRNLYLRKQREILEGEVHLVEIDLLRAGQHTTAVPHRRLLRKVSRFDYHVCVHRFDNVEDFFVYPILLAEALPQIAIPLLPDDPDVRVDLQAVMDRTYDAGPYRREIRYDADSPVPPLTAEQAAWVEGRLGGAKGNP